MTNEELEKMAQEKIMACLQMSKNKGVFETYADLERTTIEMLRTVRDSVMQEMDEVYGKQTSVQERTRAQMIVWPSEKKETQAVVDWLLSTRADDFSAAKHEGFRKGCDWIRSQTKAVLREPLSFDDIDSLARELLKGIPRGSEWGGAMVGFHKGWQAFSDRLLGAGKGEK